MSSYRSAAVVTAFALFMTTTANAQATVDDCWRAEEASAARIQALQSMLMVEALKCRDTLPAALEAYNGFVVAKRDTLRSAKYGVQAHFVKQLGAVGGQAAASDYDTQAGNRSSTPAITAERCATVASYARIAAGSSDADLLALSDALVPAGPMADCSVGPAARSTGMIIPVWQRGVARPGAVMVDGKPVAAKSAAAAPVKAVPVVVAGLSEAKTPVLEPIDLPVAAAPAVVAAPAAVAAPVSAAEALQAAAAALAKAAAAMQAQPSS